MIFFYALRLRKLDVYILLFSFLIFAFNSNATNDKNIGIATPTTSTADANTISQNSVTLGGTVLADGGNTVTERGIVYAITSNNATPSIGDNKTIKDTNGNGIGVFSESITGLKANTQYSYRAYAINVDGTSYGSVKTFTTTNTIPAFTSTPITTAGQQTLYNYTVEYKDADVDPLTITTPTKPSWLTLSDEKLVSTIAGSGTAGNDEGSGIAASFNDPSQMAIDPAGNIYVADYNNHKIRKITPEGVVSTFAGTGSAGATDGIGTAASFSLPRGIVIDSYGNFYVASLGGNTIRKITPNGTVSTFAGSGTYGGVDGNGTAASFSFPFNLTIDTSGNLYVTDFGSHNIRKITPNGDVTTIAGTGSAGAVNANGTSASFNQPGGIAVDASGNIYVAEIGNHNIRKIASNGDVTTFAGTGTAGFADGNGTSASFAAPSGITIDANGNLYIAEFLHKVRKITPSGDVTTLTGNVVAGSVDGIISQATFNTPLGIIIDRSENLYVATTGDDKIRKITSVKKLSGTPTGQTGNHPVVINANDGNGGSVNQSFSIAIQLPPTVTTNDAATITASTVVFGGDVTDAGDASVTERGIVYSVTSLNANPQIDGVAVFKDDNGSGTSTFTETISNLFSNTQYSFAAYASNSNGTSYGTIKTFTTINTSPTITSSAITTLNHGINYCYSITSNDNDGDPVTITATTKPSWLSVTDEVLVSTLAGTFVSGNADGNGADASFNQPFGIATDNYGNVFIADTNNHKIRKITPNGDVTTFAGTGTSGSTDANGTSASFNSPRGLEVDAVGNIYIADSGNNKIRKITPNGDVTTFAGSGAAVSTDGNGTAASFAFPSDLAIDINGNIFVTDVTFHKIRKISPNGDVTTFAGSGTAGSANGTGTAASFNQPFGVAIDASSNVFIAEYGNHNIRKITSAGVVSTFAGTGSTGNIDANGTSASFNQPTGLTIDKLGNIYVADVSNRKIRKITPSRDVTTFAGDGVQGNTDGIASEARFAVVTDISLNRSGIYYVIDLSGIVRKINITQKISGDGSGQTGSYPIVLQASDGSDTGTQSYTITYSINNFTATSGNWSTPGNWSQGRIPNTNENVEVLSGKTSVMDIADLVVGDFTNTGTTTIEKTKAITVNGKVTNTGTLTINSNGSDSGVLIANGASSGNIIYKRGGLLDQKWSLVSPPVIGQKIRALAGNSNNLIRINFTPPSYEKYAIAAYNDANAANAKWEYYDSNTDVNLTFDMGKGYSMSRHNDGDLTFTGTLQVDNLYNSVLADKWNAVGNPFSAYIPLNKNNNNSYLFDNLGRLAINAAYVWDNTQSKYVAVTQLVTSDEKFIAPGQGFFVKTIADLPDLYFNKSRKSKKPSSGTHIFNRNSESTPFIKLFVEKENIKINTDIIYSATATKGFDTNEDIENFSTANFDVNTHLLKDSNGKDYTIQSIPQNNYENLIVPISLSAKANEVVKFSANPNNLPSGLMVFLEDKNTNTFHNLDNNNSFSVTLNEDSNGIGRFYLHTNSQSLSIDKENFLNNISIYQLNENTIKIEGLTSQETIFKLYDILGKEVLRTNFNANNTKEISIKSLKKGIYFAEITTDKGKTNKKILLK
ncbi:T9SS type A sorting domain-containing protein [uncultured Polaribacter sp.]|uniref:T9SS type A sorting domain-containing protein n=1 Tax=uncultured Polaribacter sp. TaxID=174711 RepID=UPI00259B3618|nr:T9SS type A sorting domain-containing protein [uncultured Polaribacter sp.]